MGARRGKERGAHGLPLEGLGLADADGGGLAAERGGRRRSGPRRRHSGGGKGAGPGRRTLAERGESVPGLSLGGGRLGRGAPR